MRLAESLAPLAERQFRLLFLGRVVSLLGSAMAPVALAFAVLDLTGSASDLGLTLAAASVPQVVFLLVGGVWADRLPRNAVMIGSNIASGVAQGLIAVLVLTGSAELWHLIVLQVLRGASSAFLRSLVEPASRGRETAPFRFRFEACTVGLEFTNYPWGAHQEVARLGWSSPTIRGAHTKRLRLARGDVAIKTVGDILSQYGRRPEHKSLAPDGARAGADTVGLLNRRPVRSAPLETELIGKEGNKLDERLTGEVLEQAEYQTSYGRRVDPWTELVLPVLREIGARALAQQTGFKVRSIYDVLNKGARPHPARRAVYEEVAMAYVERRL
jgi:Transmembrane secretion effector